MVGRASSPVLVGRQPAMDALRGAVERAPAEGRCVILVEGEAGIGKSRFLAEFAREIAADIEGGISTRLAFGHGILLVEGPLPYGPIVELLDELAHLADDPVAERLTTLRDGLSGMVAGAVPSSPGVRGPLFLELREALIAAAGQGRLILVIDDAHWADRSTLDLIAYLASRLAGTSVVLLLSYRSDELDRRHPLRPLLAELQRGLVVERIVLEPLPRAAVADLIRGISGREIDAAFSERVLDLADGNPFHVEQLLALGGPSRSLPASLRDVLLARIERLDPLTLAVVRDAAVVGREIEARLLALVSSRTDSVVRQALGEAVELFILNPTAEGHRYSFRHALIREAVYEDLLPADRVALHRRVADALTAQPDLASASPVAAAAELARHRDAAQQPELARELYAIAGGVAMRARAWSEAASAYERVLALDSDHDELLDDDRLATIRVAARAMWYSGRPQQAAELLRTTLTRAESTCDPLVVAEAWLELAVVLNDLGIVGESKAAGERALVFAPRQPPNRVRVRAMGSLASQRMIEGRHRKSIRLANCVIAIADRIGAVDVMAEARAQRGPALLSTGHVDEALRDLELGRQIATDAGDVLALGIVLYNGAASFGAVGAYESGLAMALEASSIANDLGLEAAWNVWLLPVAADYCYRLGRWEEADRHLAAGRFLEMSGPPLVIASATAASLAAHRGDSTGAVRYLADAEVSAAPGELAGLWRSARAEARLIADDAPAAIVAVDDGIDALSGTDDLGVRAVLAALGARAAADLAERASARRNDAEARRWLERAHGYAGLTRDIDEGRLVRGSIGSRLTRASAASAEAHSQRAAGHSDPALWLTAVDAYAAIHAQPMVAWTRLRLGEAALITGDRSLAHHELLEGRAAATAMGDPALVDAIDALARRGRLALDKPGDPPAAASLDSPPAANPWSLSDREMEVLGLVAEGLTNREIARRLFIAEKTASSHVTHILDKVGVTSRTEAALAAARAGVLGDRSSN
jgi:DNA-binding CsgD family transcriptional regulator/tetratricopeptide (TPR) repeat protein